MIIIKRRWIVVILAIALIISMLQGITVHARKSNYMYATKRCVVKLVPNDNGKTRGYLNWNQKVKVLGKISRYYYEVKYRGKLGYVYYTHLRKKPYPYKSYKSPTRNSFKSYEDASCLTSSRSVPQGRLKSKYHTDSTGVCMVGNRYCVAMGQYYAKKVGTKIDLVLKWHGKKHVLKCILADQKANSDTIRNHKVHRDGSLLEFVVYTRRMPHAARQMGDVSYAGKAFRGRVVQIRIYK